LDLLILLAFPADFRLSDYDSFISLGGQLWLDRNNRVQVLSCYLVIDNRRGLRLVFEGLRNSEGVYFALERFTILPEGFSLFIRVDGAASLHVRRRALPQHENWLEIVLLVVIKDLELLRVLFKALEHELVQVGFNFVVEALALLLVFFEVLLTDMSD